MDMTDNKAYDASISTDTSSEDCHKPGTDEELKEMWNDMNRRISRLERQIGEEGRRVSDSNIRTAQQNLAKHYKRMMVISACMAAFWPAMLLMPDYMEVSDHTWHVASAILFLIYFITAAVADGYLYNSILALRLDSTPVDTLILKVGRLKRIHHRMMMILIPMALATIGYFISPFLQDSYVICGVALGGTVGLLIGLMAYFRMMADYRRMMADYS